MDRSHLCCFGYAISVTSHKRLQRSPLNLLSSPCHTESQSDQSRSRQASSCQSWPQYVASGSQSRRPSARRSVGPKSSARWPNGSAGPATWSAPPRPTWPRRAGHRGAGFDEVAARLSTGTGVPVGRLRETRSDRVMARLAERAQAGGDTPENREARAALREAMRRMLWRLGAWPAR